MEVRPTPYFRGQSERMAVYRARLQKKNWNSRWPLLRFNEE